MGVMDTPPLGRRAIRDAVYRNIENALPVAIATESAWYDSGQSNGVDTYRQTRKRHTVINDSFNIRLVYANMYTFDNVPTNSITVRAGLEVGKNVNDTQTLITPVYFSGSRDITITAGMFVVSDPLPISLPMGSALYSRSLVTVASGGMKWPQQGSGGNANNQANTIASWHESTETGTSYTDKTTSGTFTDTSGGASYAPCAIIGETLVRHPYIGLDGDSILSGLGDTGPGGIFPIAGRGYARRALGGTIPYISTAASGQGLGHVTYARDWMMANCTDIICNLGINDLRSSGTLASTQSAWIYRWRRRACQGAKVWQTTLTPVTTSTDNWATTLNQSLFFSATVERYRTGLNDWLRDGAPLNMSSWTASPIGATGTNVVRVGMTGHPLAGYFEVSDPVESARNSGKWIPGMVYLGDGVGLHPGAAGHQAIASNIDVTKFNRFI